MSDMETAEAIYDNFGTEQSPLEDVVAIANAITAAREEGRAAGYAEAIEKAAKVAEDAYVNVKSSHKGSYIAFTIRALLPAATMEEPK